MMENMAEYLKNADGKTRRKVLGYIFSENRFWRKGALQAMSLQNQYLYFSISARFSFH